MLKSLIRHIPCFCVTDSLQVYDVIGLIFQSCFGNSCDVEKSLSQT